jgi:hypothetical protein
MGYERRPSTYDLGHERTVLRGDIRLETSTPHDLPQGLWRETHERGSGLASIEDAIVRELERRGEPAVAKKPTEDALLALLRQIE